MLSVMVMYMFGVVSLSQYMLQHDINNCGARCRAGHFKSVNTQQCRRLPHNKAHPNGNTNAKVIQRLLKF